MELECQNVVEEPSEANLVRLLDLAERLSFIFQTSNQVASDTVPKHLCREAGRMKGSLERQENQNQASEPPAGGE